MRPRFKPCHASLDSAFTLLELFVTVGMAGLVAATVLGSRSGAVPKRVTCADNLRRLTAATQMWAEDNQGCYPNDEKESPFYIGASFRNTLTSAYQLERKDFYCPANPAWNSDALWLYPSGTNSAEPSVIGYFYFAGCPRFNDPAAFGEFYPQDGALPGGDNLRNHLPVFATNVSDRPYYPVLWTDLNRKFMGAWSRSGSLPPPMLRGANHVGNQPLGSNEAYLDGRVQWVKAQQLLAAQKMVIGYNRLYFYAGRP